MPEDQKTCRSVTVIDTMRGWTDVKCDLPDGHEALYHRGQNGPWPISWQVPNTRPEGAR